MTLQVFINGKHVGGQREIFTLNETGQLEGLLEALDVERLVDMSSCSTCGGAGYITCWWCQGDKTSVSTMFDSHLKCTVCEENGLVRCPNCTDDKLPTDEAEDED